MAFDTFEDSIEDAQPQELYLFTNVEESFKYTSGQQQITFAGNTYIPRPISRTEQEIESEQRQRQMIIKMPVTDPFVQRYISTIPATQDSLKIFRRHTTDTPTPETQLIFDGRVTNVAFDENEAKVNVISRGSILEQGIPLQTFRNPCNFILYGTRCAVVEANFKMEVDVTAISADGLTVTVDGGSNIIPDTSLELSAQLTAAADYFLGGFITRGGIEHRMVLTMADLGSNVANITVIIPFQTIDISTSLELFAGCDHQLPTCLAKFDNVDRYGGFPFIPGKNPFQSGINK